MLDRVLLFVKDALDSHLQRSLSLSESLVSLNHIRNNTGDSNKNNNNRLVMTLVKLEYESARTHYNIQQQDPTQASKRPPQFFNLNVLFAANFDDYTESLKVISHTLLFFQVNSIFQRLTHPQMPDELSSLEIEIESSSDAKSFEMWSALGASYLPSVLYKFRRIMVDSSQIIAFQTPMRQPLLEMGQ